MISQSPSLVDDVPIILNAFRAYAPEKTRLSIRRLSIRIGVVIVDCGTGGFSGRYLDGLAWFRPTVAHPGGSLAEGKAFCWSPRLLHRSPPDDQVVKNDSVGSGEERNAASNFLLEEALRRIAAIAVLCFRAVRDASPVRKPAPVTRECYAA